MDKTNMVLAFFVAAILAGLFVQYGMGRGLPLPSMMKENFVQKEHAPVGGPGMGPYDQVDVTGAQGWLSTEPAPVSGSLVGESQEGKLMFLVGNRVSSDCCPAAFNTDTGCVCLTEQDKNLMAHRGGNRA